MHHLTLAFLAQTKESTLGLCVLQQGKHDRLQNSSVAAEIQERLFALPSAQTPGQPIAGDWVYESCRIASLIYTIAMVGCTPLPAAVHPLKRLSSATQASQADMLRQMAHELCTALQQCDMSDAWGDMAGVLYWATSIGAAAAYTPLPNNPQAAQDEVLHQSTAFKHLSLVSMRAMILLVFPFPVAIIQSQKILLSIQQLVRNAM
jgi:hypothetical protein